MNYGISFPHINGETVTQGHTGWCAEHGHATHTVAGVDQGICPRCGDTYTVTDNEKFEVILSLEDKVKSSRVMAGFGIDMNTRERGKNDLEKAKAELSILINNMGMDELTAFYNYRKTQA